MLGSDKSTHPVVMDTTHPVVMDPTRAIRWFSVSVGGDSFLLQNEDIMLMCDISVFGRMYNKTY